MNIVVITAMLKEFRSVARCLDSGAVKLSAGGAALCGYASGHKVVVLESGIGFDNAARTVENAIREYRPDLVISVGFCGGLTSLLHVGDVVVAKEMVVVTKDGLEEVPVLFAAAGQAFVARQVGTRVFGSLFASTPVVMTKKKLVGMLPSVCPYPVVEMESAAIAIIATENSVPLLSVRAVSDAIAEELEFSLDEFCDLNLLRIRPLKVLRTVIYRPRLIPQLVRLGFNRRRAAESLTAALSRVLTLI